MPQSGLDTEVLRELTGDIAKERVLGDDLGLKGKEHPGRRSNDRASLWANQVLIKLGMQILIEVAGDPLQRARGSGREAEFLAELPLGVLLSRARTVRLGPQGPETPADALFAGMPNTELTSSVASWMTSALRCQRPVAEVTENAGS